METKKVVQKSVQKSVNYYILIVVFLMLFSRLLGLGRDTFIGTTFGAGYLSDAYFVGIALTSSLFLGLGSGVATTLVPIVVKHRNSDKSPLFKILLSLIAITTVITVVYYIVAPIVVREYAVEFDSEKIALTLSLMKILLPSIIFVVLTYFFVAVLQGNEIFILPASISIPFNILFFLYLIFYREEATVTGLAIVTTVGWALQMFVVFIKGISFISFKKSDYDLRKFYYPLFPIIFVALTHQLNLIIDNKQATIFGDGSASSIYYGNILFKALATTVVYGITAVMFPKFSEKLIVEQRAGLNKSVVNVLRSIALLLIPMSVGLIILGDDFINVLFQRGKFDANDKVMTAIAFSGYSSFMLAFGFIEVLNKAYYSLENRRMPIAITCIVTGFNLILSFIIVRFVGFVAIPVSTSIAYFIGALISLSSFLKEDRDGKRRLFMTVFKSFIASTVMGLVLLYSLKFIGFVNISALISGVLLGVVVYGVMIIALKEKLVIYNLRNFMTVLKNKAKNNNKKF